MQWKKGKNREKNGEGRMKLKAKHNEVNKTGKGEKRGLSASPRVSTPAGIGTVQQLATLKQTTCQSNARGRSHEQPRCMKGSVVPQTCPVQMPKRLYTHWYYIIYLNNNNLILNSILLFSWSHAHTRSIHRVETEQGIKTWLDMSVPTFYKIKVSCCHAKNVLTDMRQKQMKSLRIIIRIRIIIVHKYNILWSHWHWRLLPYYVSMQKTTPLI